MYRNIGEAIKLLFWIAAIGIPALTVLCIVLAVLLWWKW
jgi:hypothetical protein